MSGDVYESPRLLAEYLLLHYGDADAVLDGRAGPVEAVGFSTRLVRELLAPCDPECRALDLGCAVGGSSFELARSCREVVALDHSHSFIHAAKTLRDEGSHPFEKAIEGAITETSTAHAPADLDRSRVNFQQGDAQALPEDWQAFDVVLAANLLCRLPEPRRLIERLSSLVAPGGQLLLTTPFTWLEDFTPRRNWIGGTPEAGRSLDVLRKLLSPHFALELAIDLPFLIREHSRKFQYGIACGTRWRRS